MNNCILPPQLTDKQVNSICMSIRHDFGLDKPKYDDGWIELIASGMTEGERDILRARVREYYHAIYKEFFYCESGQSKQEQFPMLDGPPIAWELAKQIYQVYTCIYPGINQTLERIAQRGGFGWGEVPLFMKRHQQRKKYCTCPKQS